MSKEKYTYQEIEQYLNNEMSNQDRASFEQEIAANPELRQKVNAHRMANELVIENRIQQAQGVLMDEHLNSSRSSGFKKAGFIGIGLLLISAGTWWGLSTYQEENQNITREPEFKQQHKTITSPDEDTSETVVVSPVEKTDDNKQQSPTPDYTKQKSADSEDEINNSKSAQLMPDTSSSIEKDSSSATDQVTPKQDSASLSSLENTPTTDDTIPVKAKISSDPCENIDITADITVKPTCEDEANGSVLIRNIKGGEGPYKLDILDENKEEYYRTELPTGKYSVKITDNNDCYQTITDLHIVEKPCMKEYSFNPYIGEELEIEVATTDGTFYVYDQQGRVYYNTPVYANDPVKWDGRSDSGQLNTGYYQFKIQYRDGSQQQGSITIVQ